MTLRLMLIGAGFIGERHIKNRRDGDSFKFVSVVDPNYQRALTLAAAHGAQAFVTIEEAQRHAEADAAIVCVPTDLHHSIVHQTLELNLPTLCEKPFTRHLSQAEELISLSERCRVPLMIGHVTRFWPSYAHSVKLANSGSFGRILGVHLERLSTAPHTNDWITDHKRGGGALFDLQIHDLDFMQQLLGVPSQVNSYSASSLKTCHNSVFNHWFYPNTVLATNKATYDAPASYQFRAYFRIEFEHAIAEMDSGQNNGQLTIYPDDAREFIPEVEAVGPFRAELVYFCNQVLDDKPFTFNMPRQSYQALAMCRMAEESLYQRDRSVS